MKKRKSPVSIYVTFRVRMVGAWVVAVLGRNASDGKK